MATILVCSVPNPGHFNPMLTVALHVANQGHEVIIHTAEPFRLMTEGHGLRFIPFEGKANFDYRCFPDRSLLPDGPSRPNAMRDFLFSQPLADQFRSLAGILDKHPIDVVLTDTLFYGVLPLLQTTDARPHVICCGVNPFLFVGADAGPTIPRGTTRDEVDRIKEVNQQFVDAVRPFSSSLAMEFRGLGFDPPLDLPFNSFYTLPDHFIQFSTASMEFIASDIPPTVRFVGPLLPSLASPFVEPTWWTHLSEYENVLLATQGTLANENLSDLIEPAIEAFTDDNILVVAATGKQDVQLKKVPRNVRVVPFVPFVHILPKTDVFLTNGGYGGVSQALAAGVPIIAAGQTEDKGWISLRVAHSGVGLNLGTSRPTPPQIRSAVTEVLTVSKYRDKASRMRTEISQSDPLGDLTQTIDQCLSKRNSRSEKSQDSEALSL